MIKKGIGRLYFDLQPLSY